MVINHPHEEKILRTGVRNSKTGKDLNKVRSFRRLFAVVIIGLVAYGILEKKRFNDTTAAANAEIEKMRRELATMNELWRQRTRR